MRGDINKIRGLRDKGMQILQALSDGVDDAPAQAKTWWLNLGIALRPWGAGIQGMFEPIGPMDNEERSYAEVWYRRSTCKDVDWTRVHAVRMCRLQDFYRRLVKNTSLTPISRRGPDKDSRYIAIAEHAKQILSKPERPSKREALDQAVDAAVAAGQLTHEEAICARQTIYRNRSYFD